MLVAVCSLKGSPGVTTFSVALAARWPSAARCVLVECDPSGGDVATRFGLASSPGLVSVAAAARRSTDPELLWAHAQQLPGGLAVVAAPPGADHAVAALAALAPEGCGDTGVLGVAARVPDAVVIADCGRVDPGSVVLPIVRDADVTLLLSRAGADDLAHICSRLSAVSRWSRRPGLLLVGEGHSSTEVSRELGVPVMGRIPQDPRGAAVLRGRGRGRGRPSRSALGHSAATIATTLLATPPAGGDSPRSPTPTTGSVPAPRAAPTPAGPLPTGPPAAGATSRNGSRP